MAEFEFYLADIDTRIVWTQTDNIKGNQSEIESGMEARSGLQLDSVVVPFDAQMRIASRFHLCLQMEIVSFSQQFLVDQILDETRSFRRYRLLAGGRSAAQLRLLQLDLLPSLRLHGVTQNASAYAHFHRRSRHGFASFVNRLQ